MTMREFARMVDCSPEYFSRIANGHTKAGTHLAKVIENASGGKIKMSDIKRYKDGVLDKVPEIQPNKDCGNKQDPTPV
jgi:hypothetical protein